MNVLLPLPLLVVCSVHVGCNYCDNMVFLSLAARGLRNYVWRLQTCFCNAVPSLLH